MSVVPGSMKKLISGATATTSVLIPATDMAFGRHLVVLHAITGASTGGRCSLQLSPDGGTTLCPHHGNSRGFPVSNVTANYSAIALDCVGTVKLTLTVADGTHDVWVQVTD